MKQFLDLSMWIAGPTPVFPHTLLLWVWMMTRSPMAMALFVGASLAIVVPVGSLAAIGRHL